MVRRKQKYRKEWIVGGIIVFLMVTSVFGVMIGGFGDESSTVRYNGYKFTLTQNGYQTKYEKRIVLFDVLPHDVESVAVSARVAGVLRTSPQVYVTYDPQSASVQSMAVAQFGLLDVLSRNFNVMVLPALTSENDFGLPVVTCESATEFIPVIVLEESDQMGIVEEGNCIRVHARFDSEFIALKDRLAYAALGIIP